MNRFSLRYTDKKIQQSFTEKANLFCYSACKLAIGFCCLDWAVTAIIAFIDSKFSKGGCTLGIIVGSFVCFWFVRQHRAFCKVFLTILMLASLVGHFESLGTVIIAQDDVTFSDVYVASQAIFFLQMILLLLQTNWIIQCIIIILVQFYYFGRLYLIEASLPFRYEWLFFLIAQVVFFYLIDRNRKESFLQTSSYKQQAKQFRKILQEHLQDKLLILDGSCSEILFYNNSCVQYFRTEDSSELLEGLNNLKPEPSLDFFGNSALHSKIPTSNGLLTAIIENIHQLLGINVNNSNSATNSRPFVLNDYCGVQNGRKSLFDIIVKPMEWDEKPAYLLVMTEMNEKILNCRLKLADILKNRLLSSFSTEFRTPLNAILGFLALLKGHKDTSCHEEALEMIESNAKVLLLCIDSLIDLMLLMKDQKLKLQVKPIKIKAFAEEVRLLIRPFFANKNLKFNLDIDPKTPEIIYTDENRLKEALIHLLLNAIKFTFVGHVALIIKPCPEEKDIVFFTVEDTGTGINPTDLPHLFKLNLKDHPNESYQKGIGLGLQVSQKMAKILGGPQSKYSEVSVESQVGQGSRFTIAIDAKRFIQHRNSQITQVASEEHISLDFNIGLKTHYGTLETIDVLIPHERGYYDKRIKVFKTHNSLDFGGSEENIPYDNTNMSLTIPSKRMHGYPLYLDSASKRDLRDTSQKFRIIKNSLEVETKHGKKLSNFDILSPNLQKDVSPILLQFPSSQQIFEEKLLLLPSPVGERKDRILVVDDTPFNLLIAKSFLEELGFEVKTALNGKEAVEMCMKEDSKNFFKIIFMDCQMPIMDGYQATQELKDKMLNNSIPLTPIVAITANKNEDDINKCYECGMDGFLSKPINKERLRNQIKELFPELKI